MLSKPRAALIAVLILLGWMGPCPALDGTRRISQYGHSAWRLRDGDLPAPVYPVAQTRDGYLWIGSQAGLLRFDGARFVPLSTLDSGTTLPSPFVTALKAARDGSLWIATTAGVARWDGHHLVVLPDDRRPSSVLFEDAEGAIWFSRTTPPGGTPRAPVMCRAEGEGQRCFGKDEGLDLGATACCVGAMLQLPGGDFLVSTDQGVVRWRPGSASASVIVEAKVRDAIPGVLFLAQDAQNIWVGIGGRGPQFGLARYQADSIVPVTAPFDGSAYAVQSLFVDRDGAVWIGTADNGIYRIQGADIDHFQASDGLSSDSVYSFAQDRDGTLWVTTSEGLDRFRDLAVATYTRREGLGVDEVDAVVAGRDGRVWIGGTGALDVIDGEKISSLRTGQGLPGQQVTSLMEDHAGTLWVGVDNTLSVYENGRFVPVAGTDGKPIGFVLSLIEDAEHTVWAKVPRKLVRIRDRVAREDLPSEGGRFAADPVAGIWKGLTKDGGLAHYHDGAWENVAFENFSATSRVHLTADGTAWGSSDKGLIALKNGERRRVDSAHGLPCERIHDFVSDADDGLWLYAQCGVIHIAGGDWKAWWATPDTVLKTRLFDVFDGARPGRAPFNAASRGPDGRLWFANGAILQTLDPAKSIAPARLLPVKVESLLADRQPYALAGELVLPPNPRDIQIDYTAIDLAVPQKLRFRYRLDGWDPRWQEAGARRQAFYNDLAPGRYVFHVSASRGDGVWSESDTALTFHIAAAWYQTWGFRIACIALAVLALVLAYRWRVRRIATELRARFDERLAERTRLARDLHDTLLQTIQGSKMVAGDALDEAGDFPRMQQAMQRLSAWLGAAIDEGRAALHALRASSTETNDLAESFRRASEDCRPDGAMAVHFAVEGAAVEMHPIVRDEVYRIGYEAIRNACLHSQATAVHVLLRYAKDHLALRISDDGIGFDTSLATPKPGHFGLQGMRERAQRIGAALTITAAAGAGTTVALMVPGSVIFRAAKHRRGQPGSSRHL